MNRIDFIEMEQMKKNVVPFKPGDTVKVHVKIVEGAKSRIQAFQGVVISRQNGGIRQSFTVRKISNGVGVERVFPLHSPSLETIEVVTRGHVRRAKLYYLPGRIGKKARVAERSWGIDEELISAPQPEPETPQSETPQDEAAETAGPVVEDGSPSSQAAGDVPPPTPPAEETPKTRPSPHGTSPC